MEASDQNLSLSQKQQCNAVRFDMNIDIIGNILDIALDRRYFSLDSEFQTLFCYERSDYEDLHYRHVNHIESSNINRDISMIDHAINQITGYPHGMRHEVIDRLGDDLLLFFEHAQSVEIENFLIKLFYRSI